MVSPGSNTDLDLIGSQVGFDPCFTVFWQKNDKDDGVFGKSLNKKYDKKPLPLAPVRLKNGLESIKPVRLRHGQRPKISTNVSKNMILYMLIVHISSTHFLLLLFMKSSVVVIFRSKTMRVIITENTYYISHQNNSFEEEQNKPEMQTNDAETNHMINDKADDMETFGLDSVPVLISNQSTR